MELNKIRWRNISVTFLVAYFIIMTTIILIAGQKEYIIAILTGVPIVIVGVITALSEKEDAEVFTTRKKSEQQESIKKRQHLGNSIPLMNRALRSIEESYRRLEDEENPKWIIYKPWKIMEFFKMAYDDVDILLTKRVDYDNKKVDAIYQVSFNLKRNRVILAYDDKTDVGRYSLGDEKYKQRKNRKKFYKTLLKNYNKKWDYKLKLPKF